MYCLPDFLQPNIWTSPLDPLSQRRAYLRLAVLWAKADGIIGRLLDVGDAENRTVEALKDGGEKSPNLSPRGDVVVSTLPCWAACGLARLRPTLTGASAQFLSLPFQTTVKNTTGLLFVVNQTVICISCIFRSNQSNCLYFWSMQNRKTTPLHSFFFPFYIKKTNKKTPS